MVERSAHHAVTPATLYGFRLGGGGGGRCGGRSPYVGKWKMNPAKSNFGETTVTYEALRQSNDRCGRWQ
jgi:hypothetical protein